MKDAVETSFTYWLDIFVDGEHVTSTDIGPNGPRIAEQFIRDLNALPAIRQAHDIPNIVTGRVSFALRRVEDETCGGYTWDVAAGVLRYHGLV